MFPKCDILSFAEQNEVGKEETRKALSEQCLDWMDREFIRDEVGWPRESTSVCEQEQAIGLVNKRYVDAVLAKMGMYEERWL